MHQNFIFDATAGIRCQFDIFVRLKGIDCFDQSDRTDRDQILHADTRVIKFLCNVNDQTQIMLDQRLSCL